MVPFILPYDLDLLQSHILGHISVINEQNVAKIQHRVTWVKAFK